MPAKTQHKKSKKKQKKKCPGLGSQTHRNARQQLLHCFAKCRRKGKYICTADDKNIEALAGCMSDFINHQFKVPGWRKIMTKLEPVRHVIRILADKKTATRVKRKILIHFVLRMILFPLFSQCLIPCYDQACKKLDKKK